MATKQEERSNALDNLQIVDCDAHFTEPPDLWTSRSAASTKARMPVQKTIDGRTGWYIDDELWASTGGNTIATGGIKTLGSICIHPFEDIDSSAWDVTERLKLLDVMGVAAQIIYPNAVGFSSNHIFAIADERFRTNILQIYNDFLMDVQEESKGRLFPQALLPIWDMDLTIKEMARLLDRGATGFTFSDKPELLGLPELPEPYFAPMWDLLNETGAVANFHVGSGRRTEMDKDVMVARGLRVPADDEVSTTLPVPTVAEPYWRSFELQRRLVIAASLGFMSNARIIANLCMGNLFDRYPHLKIVSAESGIGWVPFILETLEYHLDEMVTDPHEKSLQERRPTEYFRDHIYATFWYERIGPSRLLDLIGVDNVLVETDIPHPTCLYPGTREHFEKVLSGVAPDVRRKILQDNAVGLYGLSLPSAV